MIHVIDKASIGKVHVMYNSAILKMLEIAFPGESITFYADYAHLQIVKSQVSDETGIRFEPISIVSSQTSNPVKRVVQLIKKVLGDRLFFKQLLSKTEKKDGDWLFLCTASTLSFLALKKIKKKYPLTRVVATLHGELEHIYYKQNSRERRIGNIYEKIFSSNASSFYYLLLNKISQHKLLNDGYLRAGESIAIDHPYIFKPYSESNADNVALPIHVGHVGSLGVRKDAHKIYQLAFALQEEIKEGNVSVSSIGAIEANAIPFRNDLVVDGYDTKADNSLYLSRDEFEAKISELDYALFFYNGDQFIFRASGAIFDVITYKKPIIVLKHPYFDYLFNEAGDIGYVCNSLEEMAILIKQLVHSAADLKDKYFAQVSNIKKYQEKISIIRIAEDFKEQYRSLN